MTGNGFIPTGKLLLKKQNHESMSFMTYKRTRASKPTLPPKTKIWWINFTKPTKNLTKR